MSKALTAELEQYNKSLRMEIIRSINDYQLATGLVVKNITVNQVLAKNNRPKAATLDIHLEMLERE